MTRTMNDNYYKLIIIGDDGAIYKLEKSEWQKEAHKLKADGADASTFASVSLLKESGSYLAFIDPEIASGAGYACTVINLDAILREAKNRD
jgi:hypothetical protein